jgi:hypothetical protein
VPETGATVELAACSQDRLPGSPSRQLNRHIT